MSMLDKKLFNNKNGIQIWTVPKTGIYKIRAKGAFGGDVLEGNVLHSGGIGSIVEGRFKLTIGDKYMILVGQRGGSITQAVSY